MPSLGNYYEWPDEDHYLRCEQYLLEHGGDCICRQIEEGIADEYINQKLAEMKEESLC